jgi:hypothetical protein
MGYNIHAQKKKKRSSLLQAKLITGYDKSLKHNWGFAFDWSWWDQSVPRETAWRFAGNRKRKSERKITSATQQNVSKQQRGRQT